MSDRPSQTQQPGNGQADTSGFAPPTTSNELVDRASGVPDNIFLHGYRELTEAQSKQLREFKDSALQLWNDLHVIDGTSVEQREFDHRELGHAAVRLEEMMLWIEKFFNV